MDFIPGESTQAQVGGRWSSTATNGSTGSIGNPITLTYSFVPDGTPIWGASNSSLFARMRVIFNTTNDSIWQTFLGNAISSWGAQAGITYVREMNDNGGTMGGGQNNGVLGVRGDVRIGGHGIDGNGGVLAYNYFPGDGGDMVLDTSDSVLASTQGNRRALYNVVSHEHGHGLGLAHVDPPNGTKLMEPFLDTSYFGQQFDDQLGAMMNYNDRLEKTGRNDTLATATDFGTVTGSTQTTNLAIVRNTDVDVFKFTLTESGNFGATVTPTGPSYNQGPQDGSTPVFNAASQKNLQISVLNSAGTVLATANATGVGSAESLSNVLLAPGTYYVRVQQQTSDTNTQIYSLSTNFVAASILTASTSTVTSPRTTAVDSLTISFNNPLQAGSFTLADLQFERDGFTESLSGATLNTSNNQTFTLGNLSGLTGKLGLYSLELDPAFASVISQTGHALAAGFDTTWTMTGLLGTGNADTIKLENGSTSDYIKVSVGASSYQTLVSQFSTITIDGGAGADSIEILDSLQGASLNFTLVGNNQDSLLVHQAQNGVVTATSSGVSGNGIHNYTFSSPIASLSVFGTANVDQLAVNGPISYNFNFSGGAGGDSVFLNGVTRTLSSSNFAGTTSLTMLVSGSSNITLSGLVNLFRLEIPTGKVTLADGGTSTLSVNEISFGSGTLDLRDNAFVLNYTGLNPYSLVASAVTSGRNGGSWDGIGLTSSLASATNRKIVGYAMAGQVATSFPTTFGGQPIDGTSVLARYTLAGDLNLNQGVDFTDLLRMSQNYGGVGLDYASGNVDFDSEGNVDFNDLLIVSQNYGQNLLSFARSSSIFSSGARISNPDNRSSQSVSKSVLS